MTMIVLLVVAAACLAVGSGKTFKAVSVKYDVAFNGYWTLPYKVGDDSRFKHVGSDKKLNVQLYSYLHDPRFFLLFDQYGNIAGVRTGYIKADLPKRAQKKGLTYPYTFEDKKLYESGRFWDRDIWYTSVLFVSPEVLKSGGRKDPKGVVVEDIYIKLEGTWTNISTDQCDAEQLGFTKQGCFPGMGMHYFYNMSKKLACNDYQGVFLIYEFGELVGVGINPFGAFTSGLQRTWFEDPPVAAVKIIVPNRPKCLTEWVADYGTPSMHIFFKDRPRLTSCLWPFQKRNQCKGSSRQVTYGTGVVNKPKVTGVVNNPKVTGGELWSKDPDVEAPVLG